MRSFLALLMIGCTLPALVQATGDRDAFKTIEGVWFPASGELGGQKFPVELLKTMRLEIRPGKFLTVVGDVTDEGTIKLDPTKKPATMDILGTKGPNKDKTILAIYERVDGQLRVCYDLTGKQRPAAFKTEKGTLQFLVLYSAQRAK